MTHIKLLIILLLYNSWHANMNWTLQILEIVRNDEGKTFSKKNIPFTKKCRSIIDVGISLVFASCLRTHVRQWNFNASQRRINFKMLSFLLYKCKELLLLASNFVKCVRALWRNGLICCVWANLFCRGVNFFIKCWRQLWLFIV